MKKQIVQFTDINDCLVRAKEGEAEAQCNGQGNDTVNWVYGAYKTEDEFRKCFESDDLNRISDEEILKRFKKK